MNNLFFSKNVLPKSSHNFYLSPNNSSPVMLTQIHNCFSKECIFKIRMIFYFPSAISDMTRILKMMKFQRIFYLAPRFSQLKALSDPHPQTLLYKGFYKDYIMPRSPPPLQEDSEIALCFQIRIFSIVIGKRGICLGFHPIQC